MTLLRLIVLLLEGRQAPEIILQMRRALVDNLSSSLVSILDCLLFDLDFDDFSDASCSDQLSRVSQIRDSTAKGLKPQEIRGVC